MCLACLPSLDGQHVPQVSPAHPYPHQFTACLPAQWYSHMTLFFSPFGSAVHNYYVTVLWTPLWLLCNNVQPCWDQHGLFWVLPTNTERYNVFCILIIIKHPSFFVFPLWLKAHREEWCFSPLCSVRVSTLLEIRASKQFLRKCWGSRQNHLFMKKPFLKKGFVKGPL